MSQFFRINMDIMNYADKTALQKEMKILKSINFNGTQGRDLSYAW